MGSITPCRRRCSPTSDSASSGTRWPCCRSTTAPRPPPTRGIPGLNLDETFTSGLPAGFVNSENSSLPGTFEFGSGLGVNRCNCPLDQNEKQLQLVGNITKLYGNHSVKFGMDVRRAWNLRVPSDRASIRRADVPPQPHVAQRRRRPRACHIPHWRCDAIYAVLQRADRRGRASVAAFLLRAGHLARERQVHAQLWLATRCHQPANDQRGRKRRLPRPDDGRNQGRRGRRKQFERRHREQTELGAASRGSLPVQ